MAWTLLKIVGYPVMNGGPTDTDPGYLERLMKTGVDFIPCQNGINPDENHPWVRIVANKETGMVEIEIGEPAA